MADGERKAPRVGKLVTILKSNLDCRFDCKVINMNVKEWNRKKRKEKENHKIKILRFPQ